jgi:hypothetical protein
MLVYRSEEFLGSIAELHAVIDMLGSLYLAIEIPAFSLTRPWMNRAAEKKLGAGLALQPCIRLYNADTIDPLPRVSAGL